MLINVLSIDKDQVGNFFEINKRGIIKGYYSENTLVRMYCDFWRRKHGLAIIMKRANKIPWMPFRLQFDFVSDATYKKEELEPNSKWSEMFSTLEKLEKLDEDLKEEMENINVDHTSDIVGNITSMLYHYTFIIKAAGVT